MKNLAVNILTILMVCIGSADLSIAATQPLRPSQLRCEYLVDPLGVGDTSPRLSWIVESPRRGDRQIAYQVLVASTQDLLAQDRGDLWDSGKMESDESAHLIYAGKPLLSRMSCFWKVRIWCSLTGPTQWSGDAFWTMGLLLPDDWKASWIDNRDAVLAELAKNPIKIRHASYCTVSGPATTQSASIDVVSKLQDFVQNGCLEVLVSKSSLGGDPAPKGRKQLVIEYERSGEIFQTTVAERGTLSLSPEASAPVYLRKSFSTRGTIRHAVLYVTALGLYEAHINGQRVGDHILAPDWTDYHKRVRYQAYDVTSMVTPGANVLAAVIANGWYAGHVGGGGLHDYGIRPALMAQLEITYADGSADRVVTDAGWKTHLGELLASDFLRGEFCDARRDIAGWDQPGLDETAWISASVRDEPARALESQVSPPVRETGVIKPIKLTEPLPGHWTFDLGQNMVGVVRLRVSAPAGTTITLHHAEMLNPDGTIYTTNLRGATSVDMYTCKGEGVGGVETWQPKFTFHGFRYVEVTGLPNKPADDLVTGVVLGSDTPRTGSFSCSDPRINQLMSNIQWGQRGNYLSVPTDCPQRDERLGWMGDAQVFVRTATCNADVASFLTKWLVDVDDAQRSDGAFTDTSPSGGTSAGTPGWADAGVICPWTIYLAYGDKRILERNLPAMTRWVDWCRSNSTDLIRDIRKSRGADYGDWLSIRADTPRDVIGTAYFAYSTHIVAQAYKAVGDMDNAAKYQQLFEDIKAAFNKKFVDPDGRIHGNTQCGYAMALKFDLLPDNLRAKAAGYLVDDIKAKKWHLSTGFVGVSYLLPTLADSGNADVAYKLLLQDTFPSWLFSVKQGATTMWERWDGWTPDKGFQTPQMNSFNHYSLGSCGEWLYDSVAGINWDPDYPGYKHILIRPIVGGGLTSANATIGSPYGNITSAWSLREGNLILNVTIPTNTTATVYIRADSNQPDGVKFLRSEGQSKVYEVQSGQYTFSGMWP